MKDSIMLSFNHELEKGKQERALLENEKKEWEKEVSRI